MTFTYNPATALGKVRLYLGDTVQGTGVRPDGSNFSDEELNEVLSENDSHIQRSVATLCVMLSVQYASLANTVIGPRSEELSTVSDAYMRRSVSLWDTYGGGFSVYSVPVIRFDGFNSDDLYHSNEAD